MTASPTAACKAIHCGQGGTARTEEASGTCPCRIAGESQLFHGSVRGLPRGNSPWGKPALPWQRSDGRCHGQIAHPRHRHKARSLMRPCADGRWLRRIRQDLCKG